MLLAQEMAAVSVIRSPLSGSTTCSSCLHHTPSLSLSFLEVPLVWHSFFTLFLGCRLINHCICCYNLNTHQTRLANIPKYWVMDQLAVARSTDPQQDHPQNAAALSWTPNLAICTHHILDNKTTANNSPSVETALLKPPYAIFRIVQVDRPYHSSQHQGGAKTCADKVSE